MMLCSYLHFSKGETVTFGTLTSNKPNFHPWNIMWMNVKNVWRRTYWELDITKTEMSHF